MPDCAGLKHHVTFRVQFQITYGVQHSRSIINLKSEGKHDLCVLALACLAKGGWHRTDKAPKAPYLVPSLTSLITRLSAIKSPGNIRLCM